MKVRVEYTYDPESRNWCLQVPSLGIIGGADTREQAEEQAIEAIAFTLESANEATAPAESGVSYLCLTVQLDFHHQQARKIVDAHGAIAIEGLRIKNMVRNHCLAKNILDAGWHQFLTILTHKAEEAGVVVVVVNPAGTSPVLWDSSPPAHARRCGERAPGLATPALRGPL